MSNIQQELSIQCSGAFLSTLIFELLKFRKPQEGFLLGEIQKVTSNSISDSQIHNETTRFIINITSFVPCSSTARFYSGCGNIDEKLVKSCIGTNLEKVVGWYRNRKSCNVNFIREIRIHKQLQKLLPHTEGNMIMALLSAFHPGERGTMDFVYRFQVLKNSCDYVFEGVSLKIINMTDSSSSHYIRDAPSSALYNSGTMERIFKDMSLEPGVGEAVKMHNCLLTKLVELLPKYSKVQDEHYKKTQELCALRALCYSAGIVSDYLPPEYRECKTEIASRSPVLQTRARKLQTKEKEDAADITNKNVESSDDTSPTKCEQQESSGELVEEINVSTKAKKILSKKTPSKAIRGGSATRNMSPKPKVNKVRSRLNSLDSIECSSPDKEEVKPKLRLKKSKVKDSNCEEKLKGRNCSKSRSPSLKSVVKQIDTHSNRERSISPEV